MVRGPSVQADAVHGGIHISTAAPAPPHRPWQLPPAVPLTGRTAETALLEGHRDRAARAGRPVLAAVSGLGGVGKTALALAWLHTLRPDFPGGQLYADLGARSPQGPADPAEVLSGFLRGLGVPPQHVPATVAERAARYRSLTADLRIVVLLDDADTAAQVRPLLPGGRNVTLVTSRRRMSGLTLEGCHHLPLAPLGPEASVELLADTLADDRVAAQPDDAHALAELCAGLPLAVRLVGARLAARPRRRITTMVHALSEEHGRLDALALDGDRSVRAALDLTYQALPDAAARLYRLLGLHPGPEFGSAVAAAVLACGTEPPHTAHDAAAGLLDALYDWNLLLDTGEDRYRFHDLVRLHAAAKAQETDAPEDRTAALRRIADHYLATAMAAEKILDPQHATLPRPFGPGPVVAEDLGDDAEAALDWLERELTNVMALVRSARTAGFPQLSWQLTDAIWPLFPRRKHYDQWRAAHAEGLAAAQELGDRAAECRMLTSGGLGELGRGSHRTALEMFERAARLFAADGDTLGHARTLNYRGLAQQRLGNPAEAAALFARAAAELPACGDHRAGGLARLNAADIALAAGQWERAAEDADAARTTLRAADDAYNAARAATLLGRIRLRQGRPDEAESRLTEALTVLRAMAAGYETARAVEALAELAALRGQPEEARDRYREALDLYTAVNRPESAAAVHDRLRLLDEDAAD
ncbi:ATP-binding protein [Streptomyces natalensis]|nr:tetratricopeptide repeat protein [Streptomyces natalensis]